MLGSLIANVPGMVLPARSVRTVMGIGLSAWLFRLWLVLYYRPTCAVPASDCYTLAGDAWYHHSQANLIADGHWFKNGIEYWATGVLVESAGDPPLYPLFLAAFSSLGLDTVTWHRGVSTLAGGALVVLIGLFARRLASDLFGSAVGDKAGVVAALLAAVHPLLWINDIMLLSEGLYQPLIVAVGWAGYAWSREPTRRRIVLLGVLIAFAAMTRAEAVSLFGFLLLPLVAWGNPLGRADRARQAGLGIVVGVIVLAPWLIYNNLRFAEPVTLTSATGQVLLAGSCDPLGRVTQWGSGLSAEPCQRWSPRSKKNCQAPPSLSMTPTESSTTSQ